jgi:hypothetical protein
MHSAAACQIIVTEATAGGVAIPLCPWCDFVEIS